MRKFKHRLLVLLVALALVAIILPLFLLQHSERVPLVKLEEQLPASTVIKQPAGPAIEDLWVLSLGEFSDKKHAILVKARLKAWQNQLNVRAITVKGQAQWQVQLGPIVTKDKAQQVQQQLQQQYGVTSFMQEFKL